MGRRNKLYDFFEENKHLEKISLIQKTKKEFPNKSRAEIIAKLNYWEFATEITKKEAPPVKGIMDIAIFKI